MPVKSGAQARLMYAAMSGKVKNGPSPDVAREFINATPKGTLSAMLTKKKLAKDTKQ